MRIELANSLSMYIAEKMDIALFVIRVGKRP